METVKCSGCEKDFEVNDTQMVDDKLFCFGCIDHYDDQQKNYKKDNLDE